MQMQHNASTQIACNFNLLCRAQLLQQSLHSYLEIAVGGQSVVQQGQIGHWRCVMLGQPVCYSISLIVVVICCCNRVLKVVLQFTTAAMIVMHGPDAELSFTQQVTFGSVLGNDGWVAVSIKCQLLQHSYTVQVLCTENMYNDKFVDCEEPIRNSKAAMAKRFVTFKAVTHSIHGAVLASLT